MEYQYTYIRIPTVNPADVIMYLNDMGKEGWEVVWTESNETLATGQEYLVYFKKAKS